MPQNSTIVNGAAKFSHAELINCVKIAADRSRRHSKKRLIPALAAVSAGMPLMEGLMSYWAKFQLRCDKCGRFVLAGQPGSSWVMVPGTDWDYGDERERCAACTAKYGPATCNSGYVKELCCGVVT